MFVDYLKPPDHRWYQTYTLYYLQWQMNHLILKVSGLKCSQGELSRSYAVEYWHKLTVGSLADGKKTSTPTELYLVDSTVEKRTREVQCLLGAQWPVAAQIQSIDEHNTFLPPLWNPRHIKLLFLLQMCKKFILNKNMLNFTNWQFYKCVTWIAVCKQPSHEESRKARIFWESFPRCLIKTEKQHPTKYTVTAKARWYAMF